MPTPLTEEGLKLPLLRVGSRMSGSGFERRRPPEGSLIFRYSGSFDPGITGLMKGILEYRKK